MLLQQKVGDEIFPVCVKGHPLQMCSKYIPTILGSETSEELKTLLSCMSDKSTDREDFLLKSLSFALVAMKLKRGYWWLSPTNGGKSIFLNVLTKTLGENLIGTLDSKRLLVNPKTTVGSADHSDDLMFAVKNSRVIAVQEADSSNTGVILDDQLWKRISGENSYTGSFKGVKTATIVCQGNLWVFTNRDKINLRKKCKMDPMWERTVFISQKCVFDRNPTEPHHFQLDNNKGDILTQTSGPRIHLLRLLIQSMMDILVNGYENDRYPKSILDVSFENTPFVFQSDSVNPVHFDTIGLEYCNFVLNILRQKLMKEPEDSDVSSTQTRTLTSEEYGKYDWVNLSNLLKQLFEPTLGVNEKLLKLVSKNCVPVLKEEGFKWRSRQSDTLWCCEKNSSGCMSPKSLKKNSRKRRRKNSDVDSQSSLETSSVRPIDFGPSLFHPRVMIPGMRSYSVNSHPLVVPPSLMVPSVMNPPFFNGQTVSSVISENIPKESDGKKDETQNDE